MTFIVLDANPVQSANRLCWLDCESVAVEGARIIVTAFKHHGADLEDYNILPQSEDHPLVRFAIVSAENARWLLRYAQAATIKWGKEHRMKGYEDMMKQLNKVASRIDKTIPIGRQQTLFGNIYIDGEAEEIFTQESIESNRAFYERTREHLSWADDEPRLYGSNIHAGQEEEE